MRQGTTPICDLIVEQIPALRRYARALLHDNDKTDDLVQDTLVRAINAQHQWQPGTNIRAWLFAILHNVYLVQRRTLARRLPHVSIDEEAPRLRTPATQIEGVELRELEMALSRLPEPQRVAILLVALEGLTYDEVARVTGAPVGTVRSRVFRARRALIDIIDRSSVMLAKDDAMARQRPKPNRAAGSADQPPRTDLSQFARHVHQRYREYFPWGVENGAANR